MNKFLRYAAFAALSMLCVACSSSGDDDGSGGGDSGSTGGGSGSVSDTNIGSFPSSDAISSIPQPTLGYRWVLNETFSDEFNGTTLDSSKWYDYHPTWYGRYPGYFLTENVSVADGTLQIKGSYLGEDSGKIAYGSEYTIGCGAVVSKSQAAHYGYYECCFKANKTTLSTTFWLSTRTNYPDDGTIPATLGTGTYQEELDICETVGRLGTLSGTSMAYGMNSNIHYWFTPSGGSSTDYATGSTLQVRDDNRMPSDDYNIYGCWWRDESNATVYYNNNSGIDKPFTNSTIGTFKLPQPMGMNFVVETYGTSWIDEPTEDELVDPDKNVSYYDWVRSYTLESMTSAPTSTPEMSHIFTNQIALDESTIAVSSYGAFTFKVSYTAPEDSVIKMYLCNPSTGDVLMSSESNAYAGYGYMSIAITEPTEDLYKYTVVVYLVDDSSTSIADAYAGDSFEFTAI
ncbi:MAG: hypothetical protein SNH28_05570 [Rikenellaceae bacterium]